MSSIKNDKETKEGITTAYPAFILGGIIYSIVKNFDIDSGVKGGLNKPGTDYSMLTGITLRL